MPHITGLAAHLLADHSLSPSSPPHTNTLCAQPLTEPSNTLGLLVNNTHRLHAQGGPDPHSLPPAAQQRTCLVCAPVQPGPACSDVWAALCGHAVRKHRVMLWLWWLLLLGGVALTHVVLLSSHEQPCHCCYQTSFSRCVALCGCHVLCAMLCYVLCSRPSIESHHLVLGVLTSVLFTAAVTNILKCPIGRLRPDFNARCVVCRAVVAVVTPC